MNCSIFYLRFSSPRTLLTAALLLLAALPLLAGGSQEGKAPEGAREHGQTAAQQEGHAHGEGGTLELPPVESVKLEEGARLRVVATTSFIGEAADRIGNGDIRLTVLMKQGESPHSYEASSKDLAAVETADLIFINGLGLEGGLLSTLRAVAKAPLVPVSAGLTPLPMESHSAKEAQAGHAQEKTNTVEAAGDPHFWMSPRHVISWTHTIAEVLSSADPQHADAYARRAEEYRTELRELDRWIRDRVKELPKERRTLVTDHYSLTYFAAEYGFRIAGVILPSGTDASSPSARRLGQLVQTIEREEIPAVFIGETAGQELRSLAATLKAEVSGNLKIVPLLTGSLAAPGEEGDTYIEYMRSNTRRIVSALQP